MDALRSHVAEAQARANHIVDEFESMLLVTGGHSKREVMQIQSEAGLAEHTPPADSKAKPQASPPSVPQMLLPFRGNPSRAAICTQPCCA